MTLTNNSKETVCLQNATVWLVNIFITIKDSNGQEVFFSDSNARVYSLLKEDHLLLYPDQIFGMRNLAHNQLYIDKVGDYTLSVTYCGEGGVGRPNRTNIKPGFTPWETPIQSKPIHISIVE